MKWIIDLWERIVMPIISLIQQRREKIRKEKQAWRIQIMSMAAELHDFAPVNTAVNDLASALAAYQKLEVLSNQLIDGMQGSFKGVARASDYYHELSQARFYVRLLETEKAPYSTEEFMEFYTDLYWFVDSMMDNERLLTFGRRSTLSACAMWLPQLSMWYAIVLQYRAALSHS